jgi:AcrR family transcriptional regulator
MLMREKNRIKNLRKVGRIARKLFLKQGYENTTIRQILKKTGILTGSLYNLFNNKEDILLFVFKEVTDEIVSMTQELVKNVKEPFLRFSIATATQIIAAWGNRNVLNLYISCFRSDTVYDFIVRQRTGFMKRNLKESNIEYTDDDIYYRILSLIAMKKALYEARAKGLVTLSIEDMYCFVIRVGLSEFDVPKKQIDTIIRQTMEILKDKDKIRKQFLSFLSKDLK